MNFALHSIVLPQPEGKEMKHIVHAFALSQEDGALESRWVCSMLEYFCDAKQKIKTSAFEVCYFFWIVVLWGHHAL